MQLAQRIFQTVAVNKISKELTDVSVSFAKNNGGNNPVADFIKGGFLKKFGAEIGIRMPHLISIKSEQGQAALGIRRATEKLFVEHYLTMPIERYAQQHLGKGERSSIVEIGHLYSAHRALTLPLFMSLARCLIFAKQDVLVFCATDKVISLLSNLGIRLVKLGKADQAKLPASSDNWGSYYETNPQVVMADLTQIAYLINHNKSYIKLFDNLSLISHQLMMSVREEFVC